MRGGGCLRFAAAALFLALAAYLGAGFLRESEAPETLRAERVTESRSLCLEGTVIRDERYVTCSDGEAYLPARTGERVRGGEVVAVRQEALEDYLSCLDAENGAGPEKGELRGLIYAPCAGFFSSYLDGCEELSLENFDDFTPSVPENAVGKIVQGGWFFVADTKEAELLRPGQSVTLTLLDSYGAQVLSNRDGRLVIRCREGLSDILNARRLTLTVTLSESSGIKVPLSALRHEEKEAYVYVLKAGLEEKCPVEIIFQNEDYCLVREDKLREGMAIILQTDKEI